MDSIKRYRDFGDFLREKLPCKVQKISINAGFSCPNRDGSKGFGGCSYCNNQTFNPAYCQPQKSITQQLTNTYDELPALIDRYEEALACPGVVGLIIGTRPDCMPDALLDYLVRLSREKFVLIEYGLESTLDRTLMRINRGHTQADSEEALLRTASRRLPAGVHLILGLPGESREEMLHHADRISRLPIHTLKLHQLQLIRHTRMAQEYAQHPEQFHLYTVDEYIELVERLNPAIAIDRFTSQSPNEWLIAPDWGLKNYEFTAKLLKRMNERQTWQGRLFTPPAQKAVAFPDTKVPADS